MSPSSMVVPFGGGAGVFSFSSGGKDDEGGGVVVVVPVGDAVSVTSGAEGVAVGTFVGIGNGVSDGALDEGFGVGASVGPALGSDVLLSSVGASVAMIGVGLGGDVGKVVGSEVLGRMDWTVTSDREDKPDSCLIVSRHCCEPTTLGRHSARASDDGADAESDPMKLRVPPSRNTTESPSHVTGPNSTRDGRSALSHSS
jgi:hypothetical protein